MRLQKYLAKCGLGSRRTCETFIDQGRVSVDGKKITSQGVTIDIQNQVVRFDGSIVTPKPIEWIMLYKPPRYLSTAKDPSQKSVFLDLLPKEKHHLFAVGRLDYLSEGLLLVTNDGDTTNKLIHPRYEIEKEYEVTTIDKLSSNQLDKMKIGFTIKQDFLSVKSLQCIEKNEKRNLWKYSIVLTEGKNRHIRKMLNYLNIRLRKLKRIRMGPIQLRNIEMGKWRYLTQEEIMKIHDFVKSY
ncbi:MAG: rRNA pseudouridine synthase [Candidatus Thermoplasmatota archaeon]|nr:rRNA pseudouridine synthase [Candidatus Thermoplasmatota archaeon]